MTCCVVVLMCSCRLFSSEVSLFLLVWCVVALCLLLRCSVFLCCVVGLVLWYGFVVVVV